MNTAWTLVFLLTDAVVSIFGGLLSASFYNALNTPRSFGYFCASV